jgi:hypothetical protein
MRTPSRIRLTAFTASVALRLQVLALLLVGIRLGGPVI